MSKPRTAVSLVVLLALALSACGGSKDDPPKKHGPIVVDGVVDTKALKQAVDDFQAMSANDQEAEIARVDSALERKLWAKSGLEAALGGKAAADTAFAAHGRALTDKARAIGDSQSPITPAAYVTKASGPSIGESLFGGYMAVALGADSLVSVTNDLKDGERGSAKWGEATKVSGSRDHVDLALEVTHDEGGVTTTLVAKVGVSPCPDVNGRFEASSKVDVSATKTGGTTGQRGTFDITIRGQVDDDAKLESADSDYRMQWADFANSKGGFVDISGTQGDTQAFDVTVNRAGGNPTDSLVTDAVLTGSWMATAIQNFVTKAAQQGWQSGRCVVLKPSAAPGPKGLKPSATSTIKAAPRSRIDGGPVGGTVKATLSAGGAGVEPNGSKVKADATFTYTAPGAPDKSGTVSLEARSKRGVAKASIDFDTKQGAYVASGGTEVKVSGTVTDITAPFDINGKGGGFTVVYSYTPTSSAGGTYTYNGKGPQLKMEGSGTYRITGDDPVLTLKQTGNGCVSVDAPKGKNVGCRTTTNVITLTRTGSG